MQDDLDFNISFFEELVRDKPDFVDALIPLGDAYTKKGLYEKGLEVDMRLTKLRPKDPVVWYNLACSYSLLRMIDPGLSALEKAIKLGYRDLDFMNHDSDLENLRKNKRYKEFLASLAKRNQ